jgi:phage tail sheath protein FI
MPLPELIPPGEYAVAPLLEVQRALVTICAARADVLGVLSVPAHFGRGEVLDWQTQLVNTPALLGGPALSYAAGYHPWLLVREETCGTLAPVRAVPPDGAACGMIAGRERARGVWIAPANVPLVGVLGLAPALNDADWEALYNGQINLFRPQPGRVGGTAALSAFTLSGDRLLLPISVRRLLIFLRKLALRRGQQYVFESNNAQFRRQVQVSFERLLAGLVERGALAAFQVVTSEEINTPNDAYNGRFLVALKVAPTLPIEFITVVMLRTGESLLEVLER